VDLAFLPGRAGAVVILGFEGEILWIDDVFAPRPVVRADRLSRELLAARTAIHPYGGGVATTGMGRQVHWSNGGSWRPLGTGLAPHEPGKLDGLEAFQATPDGSLYAVGWKGEIWWLKDGRWRAIDSPTNVILTGVAAGPAGDLCACGQVGTVLVGAGDAWQYIDHQFTAEDLWSAAWFRDRFYVSSMRSIFALDGTALARVDDESEVGSYCRLSANDTHLISVGAAGIIRYDGSDWADLEDWAPGP
jgi:hypothetical protein